MAGSVDRSGNLIEDGMAGTGAVVEADEELHTRLQAVGDLVVDVLLVRAVYRHERGDDRQDRTGDDIHPPGENAAHHGDMREDQRVIGMPAILAAGLVIRTNFGNGYVHDPSTRSIPYFSLPAKP